MKKQYLVESRSGGSVYKLFNNFESAKKYYETVKNLNSIITEITPFYYNDRLYYYGVGNCVGIINSNFNYVMKIKNIDINNITIDKIILELKKYFIMLNAEGFPF